MQFDWHEITSLAYTSLMQLNLSSFPIPAQKIKCEGVKIYSFQKYSEITGFTIDELTCNGEVDDAYCCQELRNGLRLILYNKTKLSSRLQHTLWHEIGHIQCGHKKHGDKEEVEAHFFAAQANAPNVLIKAIARRGYAVNDAGFLMECFGLSRESAEKKINYLSKYYFDHPNEYDDIILAKFSGFLDNSYPPQNFHGMYDEHFDELEREREKWEY